MSELIKYVWFIVSDLTIGRGENKPYTSSDFKVISKLHYVLP